MTRRGIGLAVAAVVAYLAARAFGARELQMVAVGLIVVLAGALTLTWTSVARLTVTRTVSPPALWYGETARVKLTVHNRSFAPTASLELVDLHPPTLGPQGSIWLAPLAPGNTVTERYELLGSQRGTATVGPLMVRSSDPFGLAVRTRTIDVTSDIIVYPPIVPLAAGLPLGSAVSAGRDGRRRTSAEGEDLADIREYVDGDDLRAVHWPSTAHRGTLIVRRSESARDPHATLLFDVREDRHVGTGLAASIEAAVAVAASIASHLAQRDRAITLIDGSIAHTSRPLPWEALLGHLADVQPCPVDLDRLLRQIKQGVAGDGTLIGIITTPTPTELRQLVRAIRGFSSRAVVIVDIASHRQGTPDSAADGAVHGLRAAGCRAAVLRHGESIDDRWRDLLGVSRTVTAGITP